MKEKETASPEKTTESGRLLSFLNLTSIPKRDKEQVPEYLSIVESSAWVDTHMLLILNELRKISPANDSNEENRANLAKLKTLSELIDWPGFLLSEQNPTPKPDDELPDEDEQPEQ